MYCINCGVKLGDSESKCPLCGTVPYHPDISRVEIDPLYPKDRTPVTHVSKLGALIAVSGVFFVLLITSVLCDLQISGSIVWSGYVVGALLLLYEIAVLPCWFKSPSPVIFVPCGFLAAGAYLLYINEATGGDWFLSFAFPVTCITGVIITAVVTVTRYVRRGRLYIFGGMTIAFGALAPLVEYLIYVTFDLSKFAFWSVYPLIALVFIGAMLIFFAVCRPARESMERKFFI